MDRTEGPNWLRGEEQKGGPSLLEPTATFLTGVQLTEGKLSSAGKTKQMGQANGNETPRYGESRSLVTETIAAMDLPRISFLRKETEKKALGLDLAEFILALATCVSGDLSNPVKCIDDIDINRVANFCEIFAQVDINNDGTVDWEELSSFMIEMGMKGWAKSRTGVQNYVHAGHIDSARPTQAADQQIQYFSTNNAVTVIEENASFLRVYDADSMRMRRQYNIKNTVGAVRSLCYCSTSGHFVVGTSTSRVFFFEESNGTVWKSFEAPRVPICMAYSDSHKLIMAGDMIGNLFSWSLSEVSAANTDEGASPPHHAFGPPCKPTRLICGPAKNRPSFMDGGHSDSVLSLLSLADTDVVASCSMDHTVKLWDLTTLCLRKTLLGHVKGVKHLAYCPDHSLIVSGGFSYDLVINNPYVSNPVSRLQGHCSPIAGVEHITGTSQASLITADTDGFCKLWDLRTFACVETFTSSLAESRKAPRKRRNSTCPPPTREPIVRCMTVSPVCKRVLVGGRTVDSFEILRDECEDLTDDTAVLAVCFNATNLTFVTASAWAVKVWDGATGELLCSDARQQQLGQAGTGESVEGKGEMFSMCLGAQGRTVIVGDGLGHIKVYNHMNYAQLKDHKYPECMGKAHEGSVRTLIFVEDHTLLISASADRSISIHDESTRTSSTLLRRVTNASWSEISVIKYSSHLGLIASGSTDGSIQVWNFELARHEGCCNEKHQAPVTCLAFLDPFAILLSTDAAGYLALWALPPAREGLRFRRIFTWINKQTIPENMYGGGGADDGEITVAVSALECQVEMISTSIAATSTVTDSAAAFSSIGSKDTIDESSLEMSVEDGEEEEDVEQSDRADVDVADDAPEASPDRLSPAKSEGSDPAGRPVLPSSEGAESNDTTREATDGKTGAGDSGGSKSAADDVLASPEEKFASAWQDTSVVSPNPSGRGSSCDRSFQERLAATFLKYQGERRRHQRSTNRQGRETQEHQQRVLWNTEMLSYTVYTADESGRVTTWDLKTVLIALIHIYGGHEWIGHGVGVVESPVVYSNAFLVARHDAEDELRRERMRLEAKSSLDWVPDADKLGLHRIGSWEAHAEPIVCISLVEDPAAIITSAMDRLVKLWSPLGVPHGVLRQKQDPDAPWTFRVNRQAQQDRKIEMAEKLILATKSFGLVSDAPKRERGVQSSSDSHPCREGDKPTTTVEEAPNTPARDVSGDRNLSPSSTQHQRLSLDKSCRGGENVQAGAEESGRHEDIVDVSRRPARAPRKYTEEELDRYCESCTSSKTKVGTLHLAASSLLSAGCSDRAAAWGVRRTPRRVPVRPSSSGMGVKRGRILHGAINSKNRSDSESLRAMRGRLVVSKNLSTR
ncbi:unnamed protein product [Scytosiphon promiscuus]